jgi:hypothetical protein
MTLFDVAHQLLLPVGMIKVITMTVNINVNGTFE